MNAHGPLQRLAPSIWRTRSPMAWLLLPPSFIFRGLVALRRALYRAGLLASVRLPVPVVVVGNIVAGGSGKTPAVIRLVELLRGRGFRPGVISRGYGRRGDDIVEVAPDSPPAQVGDEPLLIARHAAVPVVVGRDRVGAARRLLAAHPQCNVIVSDDGLQHYRMQRDVEIVVFDERGAGNGWLLPAGPLREPVGRVLDAHAVIANGMLPAKLAQRLGGVAVHSMVLAGTDLTRLSDGHRAGIDGLRGAPVHAVAGIGNPKRFFDSLRKAGLEIIEHPFPDHHAFRPEDLAYGDGREILMTEKDAVKCEPFARQLPADLWSLRVDAHIEPDLLPLLVRLLESAHGSAPA